MTEPPPTPDQSPEQTQSGAIAEESILAASTGDLPTDDDQLGFEPYVRALAEFLTNPSTHGPLTISVEGEWGSGKSSFMLQLQQRLIEIAEGTGGPARRHRIPLTVRFNAWRHDKDEALWAAFATEFARRVALQQSLPRRWWGHLVLLERRFRWKEGWLDLLRAVLLWISILALTTVLFAVAYLKGWRTLAEFATQLPKPDNLTQTNWTTLMLWLKRSGWAGLALGYIAVLLAGLVKLKQYVGNPLAIDLKKYLAQPNYASRISFVEQFHEDFCKVVDAYAGDKTVYVFIDDLDRCEVPKAADLMQALNLMMSSDRRGLILIIGMDREKVAAGLAVKNEKLLPYLYAARMRPADASKSSDTQLGLEFGYNFIEKFIQIPFLVPSPARENVEFFFDKIAKAEIATAKEPFLSGVVDSVLEFLFGQQRKISQLLRKRRAEPIAASAKSDPRTSQPGVTPAAAQHRERVKLAVTGDSATVRKIVLTVAPVLSNNPRRLKQFVNLFRLRTFIAAETGLFDGDNGLTLQQLGKFVAANLRWPLLLLDLEREPGLLDSLTSFALGVSGEAKYTGPYERWATDTALMSLLKSNIETANEPDPWSLRFVEAQKLLRVSPRVRTISFEDQAHAGAPASSRSAAAESSASATAAPASQTSATESASTAPAQPYTSDTAEISSYDGQPVALIAVAGDLQEAVALQAQLASRGIKANLVQGSLAGSNLAVKLAGEESSRVLFCVGIHSFVEMEMGEKIIAAIGEDRIPVILNSVEGGLLNERLKSRIFFDVREPGGFEKLVAYLQNGPVQSSAA